MISDVKLRILFCYFKIRLFSVGGIAEFSSEEDTGQENDP